MNHQSKSKSKNSFNKALTSETVRNSKVKRNNMFNKCIVTKMGDRLEAYA